MSSHAGCLPREMLGNLPQPFQTDMLHFLDCFTAPTLRHFTILISGWILTVGCHTVSRVILGVGLHESEHFGSVHRSLATVKWSLDQVGLLVFGMIVDTLLPGAMEFGVIVEDTLNDHVGKEIFGAGVQHVGILHRHASRSGTESAL